MFGVLFRLTIELMVFLMVANYFNLFDTPVVKNFFKGSSSHHTEYRDDGTAPSYRAERWRKKKREKVWENGKEKVSHFFNSGEDDGGRE